MFNLIYAEAQKVVGNKMLTAFTLWIYPVGAAAFIIVITLLAKVAPLPGEGFIPVQRWVDSVPSTWLIITAFPGSIFMRLLVIAFFTGFISGEYDWRTWKNIIPRRRRAELLIARMFTLSGMLILSLVATSIIWGLGMGFFAFVTGQEYGPPISGAVISDFLQVYLFEATIGFATALLLAGISGLTALLTRSVVGGLLLAFGLSIVEAISGFSLKWFAYIFNRPGIAGLYAFTPTYSIENLRSWYHFNHPLELANIPGFASEPGFYVSFTMLGLWICFLMLLTVLIFQRQDLVG